MRIVGWQSARYHRVPGYRSPLPPIPVRDARLAAEPGGDAWYARWIHYFAEQLGETPGPLHDGRWLLIRELALAVVGPWLLPREVADWHYLVYGDPAGAYDWWRPWPNLLPLRPLSPVDAPRVKAYRRQAREGILPPVVLWAVTGLGAFAVLDGHDRLVAALAEGVRPAVLELAFGDSGHTDAVSAWMAHEIEGYTSMMSRPGATVRAATRHADGIVRLCPD